MESLEAPNTGATGTSDGLNYEGQLQMIRAFQPEAETIGILYTTSEANSLAQLENYQALAG
ncbi:MAG TPA: ABC transporter substrate-binding protein, partial [Clostridiales bacterium]|nr:ABC transporter substrate-binding protein [Clostridiales bacterium]